MAGSAGAARARQAAAGGVRVEVYPFIDNMAQACAAADLMVCRSGASSTAEIAMMRKPSILVPFPRATDNHQEHNARAFADAHAALVMHDAELTGERLVQEVRHLLADPVRLDAMSHAAAQLAMPGAAEAIAEEILSLAFGRVPIAPP
jgi:UDP-N-acetylglucosamine--N-acetylmuramyl-(pentapeptide) pyrophosphoryl-undecaprenol N-acetylglucosamine transferase